MSLQNQNHNQELDWDAPIPDMPPQTTIPEGEYFFRVTGAKRGEWGLTVNKVGGSKYMDLTLEIFDDGGNSLGDVNDKLTLHPSFVWKIRDFWRSVGCEVIEGQPFQAPWGRIFGQQGRCKLSIREWQNKKKETCEANNVKEYLVADGQTMPTTDDQAF